MNRIFVIALAGLALAPMAQAQEESPIDVAALEGKVTSLEEQYAETKATVAALSRLKLSGYMQARYAWQQCVGNSQPNCSYNVLEHDPKSGAAKAGNPTQDNFFIRRGRFKAVYDADQAQFVLQIDVTPDGVSMKEGYATLKLPKGLSVDAGLQLFPFGYDVGVRSSADLDLLERYRGAGYWLKGEYDVGVALRYAHGPVNFRGGIFNGNGVQAGGHDNDSMKDLIGRVGFDLGMVTGGLSGWYGKTRDYHVYPNKSYDRNRVGADVQVYLDLLPVGGTAVKGELIAGKTGIGTSGDAGAGLGLAGHAWHATLTQNLGPSVQLAGRYEQLVKNNNLKKPGSGGAVKEIDEVDLALHYFVGGNYKLTAAYFHPMNGQVLGSSADLTKVKDNVHKTEQWVVQAQAKF
jgi:hypothetical protein